MESYTEKQAKRKLYLAKWHKDNPRNNSDTKLKSRYGIDRDQYNKIFADQEGKCAVCNTHQSELSRRLDVDHNHLTNKVRGLLCNPCNQALGLLKDSTDRLSAAIAYLNKDEVTSTSNIVDKNEQVLAS